MPCLFGVPNRGSSLHKVCARPFLSPGLEKIAKLNVDLKQISKISVKLSNQYQVLPFLPSIDTLKMVLINRRTRCFTKGPSLYHHIVSVFGLVWFKMVHTCLPNFRLVRLHTRIMVYGICETPCCLLLVLGWCPF